MSEPKNALPLANAEHLSDQSFEIVRLWVDHGGGSTAWIASDVLTDPRAFGRLIADLVQHGARAYVTPTMTEEAARAAILGGFEQTMRSIAPAVIVSTSGGNGS